MAGSNVLCELQNVKPIDAEKDRKLEDLLGVLSNKTRLAILSLVLDHDSVSACELQLALGLEQSTVTTHLKNSITQEYYDFIERLIEERVTCSSSKYTENINEQR